MASTLYVNKPGGVIVQLKDGSQETKPYGAKISPEDVSDAQREFLSNFTDSTRKSESPEDADIQGRLKDAFQASVNAHLGQPNSSANTVPGDYGQLGTDGAIALMRSLDAYPEAQAQVYLHEKINFGRDKVLDTATGPARDAAESLLGQIEDQVLAQHVVVADPKIGPKTPDAQPEAEGDEIDQLKGKDLEDAVKKANIEGHSSMSADEKRDALRAKAAEQSPATPPPNS